MSERILRLPEVKNRTGLSRATIYQKISERTFPLQISLGVKMVGWLESEIDAWIEARVQESRMKEGGQ